MTIPDFVGLIGGILGVFVAVAALVQAIRNGGNTPEATWQAAIRDLKLDRDRDRADMRALRGQLGENLKRQELYKADVDQLYGGVLILTAQLKRLGYEPEWTPPKRTGTGPLSPKGA